MKLLILLICYLIIIFLKDIEVVLVVFRSWVIYSCMVGICFRKSWYLIYGNIENFSFNCKYIYNNIVYLFIFYIYVLWRF